MKKAEKSAGASRAKNDKADKGKGAKGKAAAPTKGKAAAPAAKKPDAKEAAKEDQKAKGKKAAAKAEAKSEAKTESKAPAKAAKADPKTEKAPAKSKSKAKGKSEASPTAASAAEVHAAAQEVASEIDAEGTQRSAASPKSDPEADGAAAAAAAPAEPMSEEERELSSLYQGELDSPSLAHGEFKDQKTADEDRPMLPEINARDERRRGWEDRRERRRQEREQRRQARRDGHRGGSPQPQQGQERSGNGNGAHRPQHGGAPSHGNRPNDGRGEQQQRDGRGEQQRGERNERNEQRGERNSNEQRFQERGSQQQQLALPAPAAAAAAAPAAANPAVAFNGQVVAEAGLGHAMAAATANLFAQLRNGQPLPVKQLAAMLRKRNLIEGEADVVWPQLRAELLSDERAYRSAGLRPRVVHRGRDLFAPGPTVVDGENQLVASVAAIQAATTRALSAWIATASPAAFERLVYAYLLAVGYRDINWVKRLDGIAYAQATAPGIDRSVLISARAGATPVDRRGIGELRVGVEAKNLPFGTLFAAATALSPEAERELERAGRSIGVMCGDALVSALVANGIGIASTAVTVRFLDEQFLEDLTIG